MKPNKYSIGNRFFRSKQTVCLLLILAFFSVVRANASDTADSVYFHIKLDTLGGLHVGQVRQLTYVWPIPRLTRLLIPFSVTV